MKLEKCWLLDRFVDQRLRFDLDVGDDKGRGERFSQWYGNE